MARNIDTWQKLQFLESTTNLKGPVQALSGREPNAGLLNEISTCLLHGRLFSKNAAEAPLEIRPLLRHYSAINFAKALVLSVTGNRLSTLPQAHGLSFDLAENQSIADSRVSIRGTGTFQVLNDVLSGLNKLRYIDSETNRREVPVATAPSRDLGILDVTLRDVWRHTPYTESIYELTFAEESATRVISLFPRNQTVWELRFDEKDLFTDRASLQLLVERLRARVPFLSRWRLQQADHGWDKSVLMFTNFAPPADEFAEALLLQREDRFLLSSNALANASHFDPVASLPPLAGGFAAAPYFVAPIGGRYIADFAMGLIGLHALSSVVRYYPHLWTAAIHGRAGPGGGKDDRLLAMVEAFLGAPSTDLSTLVAAVLMGDD